MSTISPFPYGLGWENEFGTRPIFTAEPDLAIITRIAQEHLGAVCKVSFLAQGALNKIYKIEYDVNGQRRVAVIRVALPMDMPFKVESEVATLAFVRQNTILPIPKVYAYDSSNKNELRFPWILMEFVQGQPLCDRKWKYMSWDKKVKLVKQIALYQSQLYNHRFNAIGSVYAVKTDSTSAEPQRSNLLSSFWSVALLILGCIAFPVLAGVLLAMLLFQQSLKPRIEHENFQLGDTMSMDFLFADLYTPQGPFVSAIEWLRARLDRPRHLQEEWVNSHEGETDQNDRNNDRQNTLEQDEKILSFTKRVQKLVPELVPEEFTTVPTLLYHHDLHTNNLLINEEGDLAGVIDWEYVRTAPIWEACQPPKFLDPWKDRTGPPIWQDYPHYNENEPEELREGVNEDYWLHKQDWEKKLLKDLYIRELEKCEPAFIGVYEQNLQKREFLQLVTSAENGYVCNRSEFEWLKRIERGQSTQGALESDLVGEDTDDEEEPLVFEMPSAVAAYISAHRDDQNDFDSERTLRDSDTSIADKRLLYDDKLQYSSIPLW